MSTMKVFVTGGTGLLGANLIRELLSRNYDVRALVRRGSDLRGIRDLNVELYEGDLSEEQSLYEGCKGFDYVIHSAAQTPGSITDFSEYIVANIRGTQHMVRAVERAQVTRMIYVSSCCVFGGGSKESPGTELSEFTGFRFHSGYMNSKYLAQQWVLSEVEKKQIPILIVNPTIMIGPYDSHPSSGEIILRVIRQPLQFCPVGGKNFIDVRDAASAACNALTMGAIGECYLLASQNLTFNELYEKISRIYGRQVTKVSVPGCLLNTLGLTGNFIRFLTHKDIPLNYTNTRQLSCESYFSGDKAARFLGLPQRSIDQAIEDAILWFADHNYLPAHTSQKTYTASAA
jgi:dihydroflavonol-4-reductase